MALRIGKWRQRGMILDYDQLSRVQYRALFTLHEPKILSVIDDFLSVFGRENIKNLRVFCPIAKK